MAQSSNRRNASIAVTILLFIACASLFGGWSTTNFKKSKKRPVSTQPAGLASDAAKLNSVGAPRGTSAATLDIVAEVSAEDEARLPRFRRDRYWANETPAVTIPFSAAHGTEDVTTVECVGGSNPQTHTCRIYNACFDAELDNHGVQQPAGHGGGVRLSHPAGALQARTRTPLSSSRATRPSLSSRWASRMGAASRSRAAASSSCGTVRAGAGKAQLWRRGAASLVMQPS